MAVAEASVAVPWQVRGEAVPPSYYPPSFSWVPYFLLPRSQNAFKSIEIKNSVHIGHLAVVPRLISNLPAAVWEPCVGVWGAPAASPFALCRGTMATFLFTLSVPCTPLRSCWLRGLGGLAEGATCLVDHLLVSMTVNCTFAGHVFHRVVLSTCTADSPSEVMSKANEAWNSLSLFPFLGDR